MTRIYGALCFGLGVWVIYMVAMVIYPRLFGRTFAALSKLDPATWGIDPKQREIRNGFVHAAGAVMILVALVFIHKLEFP